MFVFICLGIRYFFYQKVYDILQNRGHLQWNVKHLHEIKFINRIDIMYDLIISLLRPCLIRRSVNLVSAVRIEGSNFNQWLSVIEIQTNVFLYLVGAEPGMSVFNSIK